MKICFPVRKQNGSQYSTLDEVIGLIGREPHGSWLAGTNQLWHGGIHISQASAPGSVLTADNADSAVPLQCMAKGEVVAWRLNQVYKTADYNGKELKYSSTFVLVKSLCMPDPAKENSGLEFYTLYMGLAPLSAFSKAKCFKAKTDGLRKRIASNFESSTSSDGIPAAPAKKGSLKKDERVIVQRQQDFRNGGAVQPFGLAKMLDANGAATGDAFWITLLPEFMEPDGEQYAQMPVWMQKAVEQGAFDSVTKPAATIEIEAGDAIGFLGEDIAPAGRGNTQSCHYAHIEVISTDSRMPGFLNNPAGITSGQKYIRLHPDTDLYTKSGEGEQSVFTKTTTKTGKDSGKTLRVTDCTPFEDAQHKTWFKINDNSWMSQEGVDQLNQYDLKELGFSALEQDSSPDVSQSLRESWVKGAYDIFSELIGKERGIQQKQVSTFYKNMIKKIDADGDGELSGKELYNALHYPELGLRDIAARLVVKHDSEWFGGSSHQRWSVFFQNYDKLRMAYAKQWLDDCEWMSQVVEFKDGGPVWHFHPLMFLESLASSETEIITLEMILAANLGANEAQCKKVLPFINKYANAYGMKDHKEIAHFLSQVGHESGFIITEENLNYSAKGMRRIFGCKNGPKKYNSATDDCDLGRLRDKLWTQESTYSHNPEKLASYVYADRMGNGGESTGEGYKYRGRGMIQLTGKDGYKYFTRLHNEKNSSDIKDFVANPDLVISDIEYGVESAFSFWVSKNLDKTAKTLNVEAVTQKVNGGQNGYSDRLIRYNNVSKLLGIEED
jgi:predicted chitinase